MGWSFDVGAEDLTLVMPDGRVRTSHPNVASALAHLAYIASWRKDSAELRARVNLTGPACYELEGPLAVKDTAEWLERYGPMLHREGGSPAQ